MPFRSALIATALLSCAAQAQEIVGFDRASFGQVVLNQTESAMPGVELEAAFGNYNNESITNYSPESVFAQLGRAVGRLDILTDAGIFPCTAFIVSDRHLLTNHHCVPGILDNPQAGATQIQAVKFVAGYIQQGVEEGTAKFDVLVQPVESHKDLDYSVLEVFGDPSATYGTLPITAREPHGGDPYWIIGHPMGEAQRISREKCKANRPPVSNNRILHTCDTLPGNSGSPVIDASSQKVVALHHAGSKKDSVNFAVPMSLILERSSVLVASAEGGVAAPTPLPGQKAPGPVADTNVCDALYTEAKAYDACFAYEAYAQQCGGHAYVGFAKGYIAAKCGAETTPPPPTTPVVTNPEPTGPLRPWCASGQLNQTESAICSYADLAALDGQLQEVYDGLSTRMQKESGQSAWRTGTRDACGSNRGCIADATEKRISVLRILQIAPEAGTPLETSGNYRLPSSQCFVTVASRSSIGEVRSFVSTRLADSSQVRVFRSNNGFYAITYRVINKSDEGYWIPTWINQGAIPSDSYCATGRLYVAEVAWQEGGSAAAPTPKPKPSGQVMYVDNNSDGGLNVRTGPSSTSYPYFTEIEAGTQVQILGASGSWSNVRIPDGRTGWVYTPLLTSTKPYVRQCWGSVVNLGPRSTYNTSTGAGYLSVRTKPTTKSGSKIMEVYQGDRVKVVARQNGWARIKCVQGGCQSPYVGNGSEIGWAFEKYLRISCQ